MFVDNAWRLHQPYEACEKSAFTFLAVMKRFVVDIGVPRVFLDNRAAWLWTTATASDPAWVHSPVHPTAELAYRERDLQSFQGWVCGTPRSFTAILGCSSRGDPGLH